MEKTIFKRKLYDTMLKWKKERDGSTALLIKGARRVGKSTLAEEFAKNEYESYLIIDFAEASTDVKNMFNDISDLDDIFLRLQFIYNVVLKPRKSVIIFDEVQNCPMARQAIRRLVQDRRYDYIETGSLLSIRKNTKDIRIPSEETRVTLSPMDYEEFRWALGDETTMPLLRLAFDRRKPLGEAVNRKQMRDFRLYMLVGGMPQAVDAYLRNKNLALVDEVKREIIELYVDDLRKIDPTGKAARLFRSIPAQLNSNASRFQVSSVLEDDRQADMSELLQDMEDSQTVLVARRTNDPNAGLPLHQDMNRFKMFVCDTGLFITLAFWDNAYTENIIYEKLLANKLSADLGYVFENVVAQMLQAGGNELYYHTWPTANGKHNYEIDFLLSRKGKICPVEVKSSGYKTHASLDAFQEKFSARVLQRYLINTKDLRQEENIVLLPVYMTPFL